jgi:hypothetical protein
VSQDPWQNPNNPQQPGGYPAAPPPAFPSYPGGAYGAYGAPAPVRPPMPNSVKTAVNLMFGGLALGLVNMVIGLTQMDTVRKHLESLGYDTTTINSDKGVFIASAVIGGLIGSGLWLWMALATRGGHNYARIVSTVFFGIGVLGSIGNLASSWIPAIDKASSVATLVVGLLAVIFVWRGESGPYFRPVAGTHGYGYPQPGPGQPGQPGQPPYGQPPYGQG